MNSIAQKRMLDAIRNPNNENPNRLYEQSAANAVLNYFGIPASDDGVDPAARPSEQRATKGLSRALALRPDGPATVDVTLLSLRDES